MDRVVRPNQMVLLLKRGFGVTDQLGRAKVLWVVEGSAKHSAFSLGVGGWEEDKMLGVGYGGHWLVVLGVGDGLLVHFEGGFVERNFVAVVNFNFF